MMKTAKQQLQQQQQQQQQQQEPNYQEIPAYQNAEVTMGGASKDFPDLLKGSSSDNVCLNTTESGEGEDADDMYAKVDRSKKKQQQHKPKQQQPMPDSGSAASDDSYTQKVIAKFNSYFATGLNDNEEYRVSHC